MLEQVKTDARRSITSSGRTPRGAVGQRRRAPDPERRRALTERLLEHVLEHGRAELTLRSAASALSVSTFSLAAHFGSREAMIGAVIDLLVERQSQRVQRAVSAAAGLGPAAALRACWVSCCVHIEEDRLLIDVCTDRLAGPALRRRLVDPWVATTIAALVSGGLTEQAAEVEATLVTAMFCGLELDLLATGDTERVNRAAEAMIDAFNARWLGGRPT